MSTSATLWPCGTNSTSSRPSGNTVPAGSPKALTTIATLSCSLRRIVRGTSPAGRERVGASISACIGCSFVTLPFGLLSGSGGVADRVVRQGLKRLHHRRMVPGRAALRHAGREQLLGQRRGGQDEAERPGIVQGEVEILLVQADAEAGIEGP